MTTVVSVPFYTDDIVIQPNEIASIPRSTTKLTQSDMTTKIAALCWLLDTRVSLRELQKHTGTLYMGLFRKSNAELEVQLTHPELGFGVSITGTEVADSDTLDTEGGAHAPKESNHDFYVQQELHRQAR